jgi:hypothetical protein
MFILSSNYLRACSPDLVAAITQVAEPDKFFIVSAGGRPGGNLADFAVPADARLQAHFGGTRRALNARIAGYLIERGIRGKEEASEQLAQLLAAQPPIARYNRRKLSDPEVLDAIAVRLAQKPSLSASQMLRELRDVGLACEQRRLTRLYRQVTEAGS